MKMMLASHSPDKTNQGLNLFFTFFFDSMILVLVVNECLGSFSIDYLSFLFEW
jgi:hypothetical protein